MGMITLGTLQNTGYKVRMSYSKVWVEPEMQNGVFLHTPVSQGLTPF